MVRQITFPNYFDRNPNFKSLQVDTEQFVNYTHSLDDIQNIQLQIKRTFLVYIIRGQARFVAPDGQWEVNEGNAALLRKGGYIMSESLSNINGRFKAFLFFLSDEIVKDFCFEKGITDLTSVQNTECISPLEVGDMMHLYLNSVMLMLDSDKEIKPDNELIKIKAKELLHHLYSQDKSGEIKNILAQSWDNEESRLRQVVEQNFCNKLNINQLAFLSGMSVSNFKRKFEKIYQTSPGKWVKEKRLERANYELLNSDKSIYEISSLIGFNSQSHFIQAFKNKYGLSPSRFKSNLEISN